MIRLLPRPLRGAAAALLLVLVAAALASCGGSSKAAGGDGGADPASIAPPGSALFLSVDVRPQGTQKANLDALARAVLNSGDLAGELRRLLQGAGKRDHGDVDFQRDIEPWLGDRLAVALPSFLSTRAASLTGPDTYLKPGAMKSATPDALLIAATTDDDAARAAMRREIGKAATATWHGTSYLASADGKKAGTVIDHLAVFGTEADVKRTIDASKGTALGEVDGYTRAVSKLPGDALATGYLDLRSALSSAGQAAGQGAAGGLFDSVLGKGVTGVGLGASADADAIRLEVAVPGTGTAGSALGSSGAADALAGAPQGAWLGIGLGDVGGSLNKLLDGLSGGGGLGAVGVQALLGQAEQALGLDVRRDLLAWMGSATLFVSGTTRSTVGGALLVHSKDPKASERAVDKLAAAIPRLSASTRGRVRMTIVDGDPQHSGKIVSFPIGKTTRASIAAIGDRFVIAIGDRALRQALARGPRLGDSAGFKSAADRLNGSRPVFYLDVHQVGDLVAAVAGPKGAQAADILHRFTQLVAGGRADGDVSRATLVAGVRTK